jgi:hypothetical protein
MRMIDREKTCCRKVNQSEGRYVYNVKCAAKAPYTNNGTHFYCRQHSNRFVIRNGNVGEILARFNTEEQVRAAFPDYPDANAKITFTQKRYSLKLVNMKNIHVLQTAQPSRLFYFNNELRLEHNTVERKTNQNIYITS